MRDWSIVLVIAFECRDSLCSYFVCAGMPSIFCVNGFARAGNVSLFLSLCQHNLASKICYRWKISRRRENKKEVAIAVHSISQPQRIERSHVSTMEHGNRNEKETYFVLKVSEKQPSLLCEVLVNTYVREICKTCQKGYRTSPCKTSSTTIVTTRIMRRYHSHHVPKNDSVEKPYD